MQFKVFAERWLGMSDDVWERHANPASGWTRMLTLPIFAFAIWSRAWLGWWCLMPVALVILWTWLNPRAFKAPRSTDSWMSKGILGERVWLNSSLVTIPRHHERMATRLNTLAVIGFAPTVYGLVCYEAWAAAAGVSIMMIAKLWFLDRMVWLFDDMKDKHEGYRSWVR